jgi:hypothetical protein
MRKSKANTAINAQSNRKTNEIVSQLSESVTCSPQTTHRGFDHDCDCARYCEPLRVVATALR